ncbi:MAG: hypothetical protein ACTSU5_09425 [Promethearchaeota archaeon]
MALFLAVFLSSLAVLLTKKGLSKFPFDNFKEFCSDWGKNVKEVLSNFTWILGVGLFIAGWMCFFFSLRGLDLSVSRTIYSTNIVVVFFLTKKFTDEKFSRNEIVMFIVVTLGTLMVTLSSEPTAVKSYDLFTAILFFLVFYIVAFLCIIPPFIKKGRLIIPLAVGAGVFFGLGSLLSMFLSINAANETFFSLETLRSLIFSALVWFFLLNEFLAFFFSQISLSKTKAAIVVSMGNAMANFIPVLGAMIIFREIVSASSIVLLTLRISGIVLITAAISFFTFVQNMGEKEKIDKSPTTKSNS